MSHINTESQNSHLQFYTISTAILWRDLEPPSIQKNHPALTSYYSLYIYMYKRPRPSRLNGAFQNKNIDCKCLWRWVAENLGHPTEPYRQLQPPQGCNCHTAKKSFLPARKLFEFEEHSDPHAPKCVQRRRCPVCVSSNTHATPHPVFIHERRI